MNIQSLGPGDGDEINISPTMPAFVNKPSEIVKRRQPTLLPVNGIQGAFR